MTKLAILIAREEGFFKTGALPARRHNPGDLRHSPHSAHVGIGPNDIGIIDSVSDGWADLERQLQLFASRGMTLEMAIYEFAPPTENDTARYLADVLEGFDGAVTADMPLKQVLEISACGGRYGKR